MAAMEKVLDSCHAAAKCLALFCLARTRSPLLFRQSQAFTYIHHKAPVVFQIRSENVNRNFAKCTVVISEL